uniref:Uncharacterized protein n=1 Tax=Arion vulgaris TaxID=1028688 RepID=A0A0B6Z9Q8_9EUPU
MNVLDYAFIILQKCAIMFISMDKAFRSLVVTNHLAGGTSSNPTKQNRQRPPHRS